LSAPNSAWTPNYTSFDSTGTQVTGKTVGKGDGTTYGFHTHYRPQSTLSRQCSYRRRCPSRRLPLVYWSLQSKWPKPQRKQRNGTIGSQTPSYLNQVSSTINYSTGALTITFISPPANGTTITMNYVYNGWMSGGTGLMDEDG